MSHRKEQLESSLARAISKIISAGLADPRVHGLLSITQVRISQDASNADVLISVLGHDNPELAIRGLQHAAGHIQSEAGKLIAVRHMPHLIFKLDDSLKKQDEIFQAIQNAVDEYPPEDDEDDNEDNTDSDREEYQS